MNIIHITSQLWWITVIVCVDVRFWYQLYTYISHQLCYLSPFLRKRAIKINKTDLNYI